MKQCQQHEFKSNSNSNSNNGKNNNATKISTRPRAIEAARHICEEARVVLSSLRGGPPIIARGELAQDLRDLRILVKARFLDAPPSPPPSETAGDEGEDQSITDTDTDTNLFPHETAKDGGGTAKTVISGLPPSPSPPSSSPPPSPRDTSSTSGSEVVVSHHDETYNETDNVPTRTQQTSDSISNPISTDQSSHDINNNKKKKEEEYEPHSSSTNQTIEESVGPYARPFLSVVMDPRAAGPHTLVALRSLHRLLQRGSLIPSSSTPSPVPSTERDEKQMDYFCLALQPLMHGVLSCRFEQTDAGADEAVEMAIADLLSLLVDLDRNASWKNGCQTRIQSDLLMEAFNTVFVTRNTFVHSPALCYHFEEVLIGMVEAAFGTIAQSSITATTFESTSAPDGLISQEHGRNPIQQFHDDDSAARQILEFLVSQLLHSPLTHRYSSTGKNSYSSNNTVGANTSMGPGGQSTISSNAGVVINGGGSAEAHAMHDETRILCLRLIQCCLRTGWGDSEHMIPCRNSDYDNGYGGDDCKVGIDEVDGSNHDISDNAAPINTHTDILRIIQDDLCLSLLMIGQGIWAYQDPSSNVMPGIISIDVLSEICATLSTLWNISALRNVLISQFESIFTGFYQRALSLLRRLPVPNNSDTFHANQIFDAEMEIILESLVDILCLHDGCNYHCLNSDKNEIDSNGDEAAREKKGGALETLFLTYDCNKIRSDVASGLIVELCRCCGGNVDEDGRVLHMDVVAGSSKAQSLGGSGDTTPNNTAVTASPRTSTRSDSFRSESGSTVQTTISTIAMSDYGEEVVVNLRHVPAHLRELCAEALVGSVKCLFLETYNHLETPVASAVSEAGMGENDRNEKDTDIDEKSLRFVKHQKSLMREAAQLFNQKSSSGIQFLVNAGILPNPVTPESVASFLRNGIVVGLDKSAVGEYLGQMGKAPVAGKSPPTWERDRFHKETLQAYCSSFQFKDQSLLDGLRMFLAAFRLPGEAQQIDRILQAFAESCGRVCEESCNSRLGLFSQDEKKASDGAYLLSFSIIMLNTDLHNANIRKDRKMTVEDFIRNNTDYGRDITDPGKELPRDYLKGIYESIRNEQIRTEGEGADGIMTFERWKDVLREESDTSVGYHYRSKDVKELVLENVWLPILSAVGGFWGMSATGEPSEFYHLRNSSGIPKNRSGMLGAQGARLGMDLSVEMLSGFKNLSRIDIFQDFFTRICLYTGLIGNHNSDAVERTAAFVDSVERQSAVIISINTARENGDILGSLGWKYVWAIIFELRDLKLLGGGSQNRVCNIMLESDPDLLRPECRRDWSMRLIKEVYEASGGGGVGSKEKRKQSLFGAMGRALFGADDDFSGTSMDHEQSSQRRQPFIERTVHGKEELVLWDDLAPSDDETEYETDTNDEDGLDYYNSRGFSGKTFDAKSVGGAFEKHLLQEDQSDNQAFPVTGLETYDDVRVYQMSPRARVRKRLGLVCDFTGLLSETRFLGVEGLRHVLDALDCIINSSKGSGYVSSSSLKSDLQTIPFSQEHSSETNSSGICISPASEALAEVLICEIALKNRDRIGIIWKTTLQRHFQSRLKRRQQLGPDGSSIIVDGGHRLLAYSGIEKCVTGLLRICYHTVHRDDVADEILGALKLLYPPVGGQFSASQHLQLDKHLGEGLWRICRDVDGLRLVGVEGWEGLLGLVQWCASRGQSVIVGHRVKSGGLADDDPSLQAFRCIHLMLHSSELKDVVPFGVVNSIRALITGGERQNCPKLSIAGLDLLLLLHTRLQSLIAQSSSKESEDSNSEMNFIKRDGNIWLTCWLPVLEGMAEASESRYANVRQHSIAMLTDAIVDKHGEDVPTAQLCRILNGICVPMAGQRLSDLLQFEEGIDFHIEEVMIELELCVSLIFKPFLHHLKRLLSHRNEFAAIWISMLAVLSQLLSKEIKISHDEEGHNSNNGGNSMTYSSLLFTTKELAAEHLRNAIMVLISNNILQGENSLNNSVVRAEDISSLTWNAIEKISFCEKFLVEWKQLANAAVSEEGNLSPSVSTELGVGSVQYNNEVSLSSKIQDGKEMPTQ